MNNQPIDPRALKAAELKPCPFCGGNAFRDFVHDENHRDICCESCGQTFRMTDEQWNSRIIQSHFAESVNGKLLEAAKSSLKAFKEFGDKRCRFYHNGQGAPCGECFECALRSLEHAINLADGLKLHVVMKESQPPSMADELAEALRKSVDNCFRCDGEGIVRRLENEVCPQCGKHRELLARFDAQKGQ